MLADGHMVNKEKEIHIVKKLVWHGCIVGMLVVSATAFADTIRGSRNDGFQIWTAADLNQNGAPYWDNRSLDGNKKNIGYYLINAPTAPLAGAPGPLPFWGSRYNRVCDTGGGADLNFCFQRTDPSCTADLKLEVAAAADIDEFGWYDTTKPSILHPIFTGPDSAPASTPFIPSAQYGFYLKRGTEGTFYTQSSLNPFGDRSHQQFAVFEQSAAPGAEVYWIGIENQSLCTLGCCKGGQGDYNDMLVCITCIPEPSTVALVCVSILLMIAILRQRRI